MSQTEANDSSVDGWTRVGRNKGARAPPIKVATPVARDTTIDRLVADFETKTKTWRQSFCRKQCRLLLDRKQPDEGWNIAKGVILASGSFSRDNWECQRRSMWQLVACVDLIRSLQTAGFNTIQIFAQDPNYTAMDKEFLQTLDVNILDITWAEAEKQDLSLAKEHLGPGSIVFELFMDMGYVSMETLIVGGSKIYVASSLQNRLFDQRSNDRPTSGPKHSLTSRKMEADNTQSSVFETFKKTYCSYRFPRFEEDPLSFEGLMFHWNEPEDDDEE